jgi:hypothetical protein
MVWMEKKRERCEIKNRLTITKKKKRNERDLLKGLMKKIIDLIEQGNE